MWTAAKLIIGKVSPEDWLLIGCALLVIFLFIRIKVLETENKLDVSNLQVAKNSLQTAISANQVDEGTIAALEKANAAFKAAADANHDSMNAAVDRLAGISNELSKNASSIATQSAAILAEPTCEKLAHADIAALCPDLSNLMRTAADRQRNFLGASSNPSH